MVEPRARPADTDADTWRRMVDGWRAMEPHQKAQLIRALSAGSTRMAVAGIRERYPDASDEEVLYRLAVLRIDKHSVKAAVGWDADAHGL